MTAARREMKEELGLDSALPLRFLFHSRIRNSVESENVGVFSLVSEGPFTFQRSEIDEVRFFTREELTSCRLECTPNLLVELEELNRRGLF